MRIFTTLKGLCEDAEFLKLFIKFAALSYHLIEVNRTYPFRNPDTNYFIGILKNLHKYKRGNIETLRNFIDKLDYDDCLTLGLIQNQCYSCSRRLYCEDLHWALSYSPM